MGNVVFINEETDRACTKIVAKRLLSEIDTAIKVLNTAKLNIGDILADFKELEQVRQAGQIHLLAISPEQIEEDGMKEIVVTVQMVQKILNAMEEVGYIKRGSEQ